MVLGKGLTSSVFLIAYPYLLTRVSDFIEKIFKDLDCSLKYTKFGARNFFETKRHFNFCDGEFDSGSE